MERGHDNVGPTPDPDTPRVLGTAGAIVALTGLTGGAALVAVTTRIAQQARALPTWTVWVSYAVAVLCLSGFWSAGMASAAFGLWILGAVIGVLEVLCHLEEIKTTRRRDSHLPVTVPLE